MTPIHAILHYLLFFIAFAARIYSFILVIRVVISWINPDPYNPVIRFLYSITDPLLDLFRRLLPIRIGMIDLSPLILFGLLYLVERLAMLMMYKLPAFFPS